jgi:C1A family cysteine protease
MIIFNVKPSPKDERDRIYKVDKPSDLRSFVDLREWDTKVESQGSLGSCSANAITNAYELCVNRMFPEHSVDLSRLFIYYNTRAEYGDIQKDEGMYLRDGLKSLKKLGVCSEELWPYNIEKFDERPSQESYKDAEKRKIISYEKIISIYYMTEALNSNKPVIFGMEIYDSFMDLNKRISTVTFPGRKEKSLGGHAMCIVGYNLKKRLFLAKNSFGINWGDGGYCWVPFDYIRQEGYDVWIFNPPDLGETLNVLLETLPLPLL